MDVSPEMERVFLFGLVFLLAVRRWHLGFPWNFVSDIRDHLADDVMPNTQTAPIVIYISKSGRASKRADGFSKKEMLSRGR